MENFPFDPGRLCLVGTFNCGYSLLTYCDGEVECYTAQPEELTEIAARFGILIKSLLNLWKQIPSRRTEMLVYGSYGKLADLSLGPGMQVPILPMSRPLRIIRFETAVHPLDTSIAAILVARQLFRHSEASVEVVTTTQIRAFRIAAVRLLSAAPTLSLEECRTAKLVPLFINVKAPSKETQQAIDRIVSNHRRRNVAAPERFVP